MKNNTFDYELIDSGDQRRIERFGPYVINRPCPQAVWRLQTDLMEQDIYFDRENKKWTGKNLPENWNIQVGKNQAELKLSPNGQLGIFPEQWDNWQWIEDIVEKSDKKLKILNTFSLSLIHI